jgi:chemotaxis response regulator CheB
MNVAIVSERRRDALTLRRVMSVEPAYRVAWIAQTLQAATVACCADQPDLILLVLPLTRTDPTILVRHLRSTSPCPILIVSDTIRGNGAKVFDAVAAGAFDVVGLPPAVDSAPDHSGAQLLAKIGAIARFSGQRAAARAQAARRPDGFSADATDVLVCIGASAGGPAALATLLRALPGDFPAGIVIVQHVAERFVQGMTEWLGGQCGRDVRVAAEGDRPGPEHVLMASALGHLGVRRGGRLCYTAEPRHAPYIPSVDVFFQSASLVWPNIAIGVLLTGMGKDGAVGLKALRDKGHHTIAQDEASSAVYGMPKAAAELNAAVEIQPLESIPARLMALVGRRSGQPV